jgi:2-polyprenyl-6-methoxyphenol hydroxylase-like FAD-dependent oxidoreductase
VLLLGDAAHATTPNLGQGGCQAVEDAWTLAQLLRRQPDPALAFPEFTRLRRPKVDDVVRTSWMLGQVSNAGGWLAPARNALLRATPAAVAQRQLDRLLRIAP